MSARLQSSVGWHRLTVAVTLAALVVQLVLVITGASVLAAGPEPPLLTRLLRFVSYFTIESNVLVLASVLPLALHADHDGGRWRVVRLDAVAGIVVTGLVHWFFLRPILHLTGWSWVADRLLHLVVPVLAVVGWAIAGPRPRVSARVLLSAAIWPVAYMVWTVIHGAVTGWYPYPFVDVMQHGYLRVAVAGVGIAVLLTVVALLVWAADRWLPPAPADVPGRVQAAGHD